MNNVIVTSVLLPLAVGLIPAILAYMLARKKAAVEPDKIKAETAALLTTGYEKLVQDYQEQITSMKTEVGKLQRRQEEVSTEYMAMLRQDQGEIEAMRGGMRDLERLITRQADELKELRKALAVAEARITGLEKENASLRSDNATLVHDRDDTDTLRGGMQDMGVTVTRLSNEVTELRKALGLAEDRITELEKENEILRCDNLALMQELLKYRGNGDERG